MRRCPRRSRVVAVEDQAWHLEHRIAADDHAIEITVMVVIAPRRRGPDYAEQPGIRIGESAVVIAIEAANPAIVGVPAKEQIEIAIAIEISHRHTGEQILRQARIDFGELLGKRREGGDGDEREREQNFHR